MRPNLKKTNSFAFLLLLFFTPWVQSETIILSDFDDTIVEGRKSKGGTFVTKMILYRIQTRSNVMQPEVESLPEKIEVSAQEFYNKFEKHMALNENQPGSINMKVTLEDGTVVRPGYYITRGQDTYKYFHESTDGTNYLLEDFKKAESRDPAMRWKGPFWQHMVDALSHPETAKNFGLVTSRGHSKKEYKEFFKYLKKQGYIKHLPNFNLIFALARPEFDQFRGHSEAEHKANVVEYVIRKLKQLKPKSGETILDANGENYVESHYVIFAENKQSILEKVMEVFRAYTQGRLLNAKFAIFNAGLDSEVKKSSRPTFAIIQSTGTTRKAKFSEKTMNRLMVCQSFFGGKL